MFSFFRKKKTDPKASLKKVLGEYELPSFPGAVMETLRKIRAEGSSASSVADILSVDPGLTVRVLRMANSPVFSPVRKVENLPQAIALIGMSQLESLVLSVAVGTALPRSDTHQYDFKRFWRASVRRGVTARALAAVLCPPRAAEAFTSGFLQDLAVPFLAHMRPREYAPILEAWLNGNDDLAALERSEFPWDHAEVATWLCSEWDLPEKTASAIGGHHGNDDDIYDCPPPVSLVALLGETDQPTDVEALVEEAHASHNIPKEVTQALVSSSFQEADDLSRLIA
jgi:HD-like signal output (HDOD) protein